MDMSHLPNTFNGAETTILHALGSTDWQTWTKPRGKTMASIIAIGPGAGGGGGCSGVSGSNRGGGGGGAPGSIGRLLLPLDLLPDTLFAHVAPGGLGGAPGAAGGQPGSLGFGLTWLAVRPDILAQNRVLIAGDLAAGGGGAGTAAAAGAAGTPSSAPVAHVFSHLGLFAGTSGTWGAGGGLHTGAAGSNVTFGSYTSPLCGGSGGAGVGVANTDYAGGNIIAGGWFPTITGGLVAGGHGQGGYCSWKPFGMSGGSGGGSNGLGVGGNGGDGAIGCGGGGGGGGVTGGSGGRGGNGLIMITCW